MSNDLEPTLADLVSVFVESQEPLGAEFERVLFANLWELYTEYDTEEGAQ